MGKETANQARQRFSSALVLILNKYANKNIAVISYETVITLFRKAGLAVIYGLFFARASAYYNCGSVDEQ
jgi:broad specificity phosphatase PhoE